MNSEKNSGQPNDKSKINTRPIQSGDANLSRTVVHESFGGTNVLELQNVPKPHAGPNEVRVRVKAAGLNPMDWLLIQSRIVNSYLRLTEDSGLGRLDWLLSSLPKAVRILTRTAPPGFGYDLAGIIDEVGENVEEFTIGDRVYGGALGRAVADYAIIKPEAEPLLHTPDGVSDEVASTLPIAGLTATAALDAINLGTGDTVLIGGAAGGVGVFAVQLARLRGASVIGTCSKDTFGFLRELGAEPVTYGPGLADRIREIAEDNVSAATSLVGNETIDAALELGVPPERISTIDLRSNPPKGVRVTGGSDATPDALGRITDAIREGKLSVPIAATFPIENVREAVDLQRGGHVHGKVVITL